MIYFLSIVLTFFTAFTAQNSAESSIANTASFVMPVQANTEILAEFGPLYHPVLKEEQMHIGVGFATSVGDPVFAAGNGTVIFKGYDRNYGNMVEIQHEDGFITRYAHLSSFGSELAEGSEVNARQIIAYAGQTGLVTSPKLHFQLWLNGEAVNPMTYINIDAE
ncbi:MAG: M23 family metallopeptidase [Balneolales bacterium]|nr:M23 family metallopeptidase [Balneolales bacterium]